MFLIIFVSIQKKVELRFEKCILRNHSMLNNGDANM